jgi:hypothetical protein
MSGRIFIFAVIFIYLTGVMAGCGKIKEVFQSSRNRSPLNSYISDEFPESQSGQIASDIVERLQSGYPPGQTSLYLTVYLSGQGQGPVAQAVEDLLRTKGFTILNEPNDKAVTVAWRIDKLDDQTFYLMVNLSSGYRFTRLYSFDGQRLTPTGLLSQGVF